MATVDTPPTITMATTQITPMTGIPMRKKNIMDMETITDMEMMYPYMEIKDMDMEGTEIKVMETKPMATETSTPIEEP